MIKTIIFDVGNVLADFTWKEFIEKKGFTGERLDRIAGASVKGKNWSKYDIGILTDEEMVQLFVDADPEMEADIRSCFADQKGIVSRNDYAIPWLQELKEKGYQLLYLSNFSNRAHIDCADALDFVPYMDGGIFSFREHVIKPEPEIYQLLIDRYHLLPEECVFLDDVEQNLRGAERFGIHTILFENQRQAIEALKQLGVE
ncbi:MAG: HAD family phosphatase [Muribaculaceae bacterium]|nr:HAD family phosphatase [Muribaculaceae bacterium]